MREYQDGYGIIVMDHDQALEDLRVNGMVRMNTRWAANVFLPVARSAGIQCGIATYGGGDTVLVEVINDAGDE